METGIIIRFFNENLEFIGEVDDFTSFIFERKWFTFSSFQLVVEKFNKELFKDGNYIVVNNDPYRSGQIKYINVKDESVTIKGNGLGAWFLNRVTYPTIGKDTFYMNDYIENTMYELAKYNAITSSIVNRNFLNLTTNASKGRGNKLAFETRYKYLSDELETLSKASKLGWCIKFDFINKLFVFEVLSGNNLTVNQTDNPTVVFSRRYDNALNIDYIKDTSSYKNCAIVAGQGEGAGREILIVNNNLIGEKRKELFVDARDIEDGSNLADRGLTKLAENGIIESFEVNVDSKDYRISWDLGDIVNIIDDEIEVISEVQIIEVRETYEDGALTIEPIFGEVINQFRDKFKQIINTPIYENTKTIISNEIPKSKGNRWLQILREE